MAAVAGATVGALLALTLPKVVSLIGHRNVQSLESELRYIQAALQDYASSRNSTNQLGRAWIEDIRLFADEIECCIDRFVVEVMPQGREAGFLVGAARRAKKKAITGPRFAFQIRKLHKEASKINERYARYKEDWKSDGSSSSTAASAPTSSPTTWPWQPSLKVGIDKPVDELLKLVVEAPGREPEAKLKVISIVGYGGLGKTLLADEIYYHKDVCAKFTVRARVEATRKGVEEVLREILLQVRKYKSASTTTPIAVKGKGILKEVDEEIPDLDHEIQQVGRSTSSHIEQLTQLLQKKDTRYLIVIDDIQTEELCDIIPHFPSVDGVDSRIIVTTTIQRIAMKCSYENDRGCVYKVNTLSDKDSKELFFNEYSGGECSEARKADLELSALLTKCDGLPLALVCTARFLQNGRLEKSRCDDACHKLCDSEQSDHGLQRMRRQLVSNYESLYSLGLQDLLLYFCMFPRHHPVSRKALIRRWVAEGLVRVPQGAVHDTNSWDEALKNLEALIDRNIIYSVDVSKDGNAKRCRPPGMMLEYISRKSMTQHFTFFCGERAQEQGGNRVRRLSLRPDTAAANLPKDLSRLRTLVVFPGKTPPAVNCEPPLNFKKCNMLQVLDLEECCNLRDQHLQKICNLMLLKYLSLGESITTVPKKISKLKWLETLDLRKTTIKSVPVQVIQLPKLRHLLGQFEKIKGDRGQRNLELLLKDSQLETLSGIVTGKSKELPQLINHMKQLNKVKIWCKTTGSGTGELDQDFEQAIKKFICQGNENAGRSLSIDLQDRPQQFLDKLEAPGSLGSLKLNGKLTQFPKFISQLNHIKELCLAFTNVCQDDNLTKIASMKTLKYLKLVEEVLGPLEIRHEQFPSLERICLVGVITIKDITTGNLPYLESLHMICETLNGLAGIKLRCFKQLKEIAVLSSVGDAIKEKWQKEAMNHPRTLQVSFVPSSTFTADKSESGSGSSSDP